MVLGRWAATGCFLGMWVWGLNCSGAGLKGGPGLLGRPHNELPGVSYLLPHGLGREVAGILAHGGRGKSDALAGNKGTTTLAAGINAFLSPAVIRPPKAAAGVISDGSLGSGKVSSSGGTYAIPASVGTQVGSNLFESFSEFNLLSGEAADFQGPSSVQDIIARVTGGGVSSIDGTIESNIQGANLFLINPAGMVFGPSARLNLGGAFTVSTADYVSLADGGKFNSILGAGGILTAAPVNAFGFVGAAPARVSVMGSTLAVSAGEPFSIVSGDMTFSGCTITGAGSRLNLISVQSSGIASLSSADPESAVDTSDFAQMGNIDLTGLATLNSSGVTGGGIVIRCGQLMLNTGEIASVTSGASNGGAIDIAATVSVTLTDSNRGAGADEFTSFIETDTIGSATAGDVSISSPLIDLSLGGDIASGALGSDSASASGGRIILSCKKLNIADDYTAVDVVTDGPGAAGEINVTANMINIAGDPGSSQPGLGAGLLTEAGVSNQLVTTGGAGSITVKADSISLSNGGNIQTMEFGTGDGGGIVVNATSLVVDGGNIVSLSKKFATGNTGDLVLKASDLLVENGGLVGTFTFTSGAAGSAGITANSVQIESSGEIGSASFASGHGGDVSVEADSLKIDGVSTPANFTGIFATVNQGATGNSGSVTVSVDGALQILDSGEISTDTESSGNGGDIVVHAGSLNIDGGSIPLTRSLHYQALTQ